MNEKQKNVLGEDLEECSNNPLTGWHRDGCCNTDENDRGLHVVCAILTEKFLEFAKSKGNDLITPAPQFNFPGLKPGDRWCVCLSRWIEAKNAGLMVTADLEATDQSVLALVPLETLERYASR